MAYCNDNWYWYVNETDSLFAEFLMEVSSSADFPLIFSISYGGYELSTAASVKESFQTEAIKLAARGVTLVVSSGDDGVGGDIFRNESNLAYAGYYPEVGQRL